MDGAVAGGRVMVGVDLQTYDGVEEERLVEMK